MKSFSTLLKIAGLLAIVFFFPRHAALAQEEAPAETLAGPVYIVQPGDTLSSIALDFGVTVDDILIVNNFTDANSIFVGDRIIIPGLEGVSGVLTTQNLAYGDNLSSLTRRYQIPTEIFLKLNRLVGPNELVVGASLVLPVQEGRETSLRRTQLKPGQTILELAVLENTSTWALSTENFLPTPSFALPEDTLVHPLLADPGPGAFPSGVTGIDIPRIFQGEVARIKIGSTTPLELNGTLGPYFLQFFPQSEEGYVTLQGVHALVETGMYPLSLWGTTDAGEHFYFSQMVYFRGRDYIFEYINVPPALIDPELSNSEFQMVKSYTEKVTPDKLWNGVFAAPSPFDNCINSTFGNRRSYNGSAFTFYHAGVDFCGGTGVNIFAPAPGKVVFVGSLEVYGNLTIIDHGWGVSTAYLHQSEIFVEVGDLVETGEIIGLVGNSGRSTGPHLHWEVWVGGIQVNPLDWLVEEYP